jgi:aldehyde:ferredoxin oxidoreductase
LRARLGTNFRIATIGPAGELGVRYATVSHDGRHAGRGGSGAVMGAKNIKAIAGARYEASEWAHPRVDCDQQGLVTAIVSVPPTAKVP